MTDDSHTPTSLQQARESELTEEQFEVPRWSASETLARALGTAPVAPPGTNGQDAVSGHRH